MDQTKAENTRAASDRTWIKDLESRFKSKKSSEYAPYGLLYLYFVATCVAQYGKFGWRLTPSSEDLMLGSQTVRNTAERILSTQYKSMFQPTHKRTAAAFFQEEEYDRMISNDESVHSAVSAGFVAWPSGVCIDRCLCGHIHNVLQIWWMCPELLAQMDSGLYVCGKSTLDSTARDTWVVERVEYHRRHWRKFKEMYAQYFEDLASARSNQGRQLDEDTGLNIDCVHHCQMTRSCAHSMPGVWM
jgi:hypothetical protein